MAEKNQSNNVLTDEIQLFFEYLLMHNLIKNKKDLADQLNIHASQLSRVMDKNADESVSTTALKVKRKLQQQFKLAIEMGIVVPSKVVNRQDDQAREIENNDKTAHFYQTIKPFFTYLGEFGVKNKLSVESMQDLVTNITQTLSLLYLDQKKPPIIDLPIYMPEGKAIHCAICKSDVTTGPKNDCNICGLNCNIWSTEYS